MKCGRVRLQERTKTANNKHKAIQNQEKPRRYCQKRLVNPEHEEDPRWSDIFNRFHCNDSRNLSYVSQNSKQIQDEEDLFLSVQNLKFQGDEYNRKRPRTGFKYKTLSEGNNTHRMFVKQVVTDVEAAEEDRPSQLTSYYEDYAKYLAHDDRASRPSSGKSSFYLQGVSSKVKENKAVQVDITTPSDQNKTLKVETKIRKSIDKTKQTYPKEVKYESDVENTTIAFHKSGKRSSLTISRAQSPETLQVIRVDVVCNYSGNGTRAGSARSDYDDCHDQKLDPIDCLDNNMETVNLKRSHFASKYLLTSSNKALDENVAGGAKVTLMCKTFRLSDRSKTRNSKAHASLAAKPQLLK